MPKRSKSSTLKVLLSVPEIPRLVSRDSSAYHGKQRIDLRLTTPQASTLKSIRTALELQGAKLANGAEINSHHRAIQWILEQTLTATLEPDQESPNGSHDRPGD